MTITVKNLEIRAVKTHFEYGGHYGNMYYTFSKGNTMMRINKNGNIKFYNNEDKFYRAVVRFTKRGY